MTLEENEKQVCEVIFKAIKKPQALKVDRYEETFRNHQFPSVQKQTFTKAKCQSYKVISCNEGTIDATTTKPVSVKTPKISMGFRPRNSFIIARGILNKVSLNYGLDISNSDRSRIASKVWKDKRNRCFKYYFQYLAYLEDCWHEGAFPNYMLRFKTKNFNENVMMNRKKAPVTKVNSKPEFNVAADSGKANPLTQDEYILLLSSSYSPKLTSSEVSKKRAKSPLKKKDDKKAQKFFLSKFSVHQKVEKPKKTTCSPRRRDFVGELKDNQQALPENLPLPFFEEYTNPNNREEGPTFNDKQLEEINISPLLELDDPSFCFQNSLLVTMDFEPIDVNALYSSNQYSEGNSQF